MSWEGALGDIYCDLEKVPCVKVVLWEAVCLGSSAD